MTRKFIHAKEFTVFSGQLAKSALVAFAIIIGLTIPAVAETESGGTQNFAAQKYFTEGTRRSSDGDFVGAVISLTLALHADAKYGQAYANRAAARFNLRDYEGAVEDIDIAHKYLPNVASVTALQGRAHEALARAGTNGAQGQDEAHQQAARQAARQAAQASQQATQPVH